MRTVTTRAGALAVDVRGQGPTLVLLHANGHSAQDFDAVLPALTPRFRTVTVDWPAMGDSPPPSSPRSATAALFADALEDVAQELAPEGAIYLGNSVGGFAAARLAARRPEQVRGLVLVDTGGFTPRSAITRAFCWVKGREWVTRRLERRFAGHYLKRRNAHALALLARVDEARRRPATVSVVAAVWRSFSLSSSDVTPEVAAIRAPTLLVWGKHDPVLRAHVEGRIARRLLPVARYVEMDTGHAPFVEDPEAFLGAALPFLSELA